MNDKLVLINNNTLESLEEVDVLKIVEKFTKTGIEVLSADFGFMFWKLNNQDRYRIIYVSPETPYKPKLPRKRGYNYKASKGKIPYFVTNPKKDLLPYMKSLAIVPIFYKNYQYGNIVLCFKKRHHFTREEKPLVMTLGNSAAHVLTIQRSNQKDKNEAQKLLKQKDDFLNIASHELKTPITTIKGFSQILSEKIGKDDKNVSYFINKINLHADKLTNLVNDLLDVSSIQKGKLKINKNLIDLKELVKRSLQDLRIAITLHKLSFKSTHKRVQVLGDSGQIERVLTNLITNAAKYSPAGSEINVDLNIKNGQAVVKVEDFGMGISIKNRPLIFKHFFQVKKNKKDANLQGLGLGLYIARGIIKEHGGKLDFESKGAGLGSIFYFSLPYKNITKNNKASTK